MTVFTPVALCLPCFESTFSSFSVDVVGLAENERFAAAALHAVGNLAGAGLAIGLAWVIVS